MPELTLNYLAIVVAAVAIMPVGFLWFGPGFGKAWAKEMNMEDMDAPSGAQMGKSMTIFLIGNLLIAFVLAHSIEVWQPEVWGKGDNDAMWIYGLNGAVWTWLGFFVPLQINRVAWEMRSWKLVAINSSFDLTRLLIIGMILAYWQ